MNTNTVDSWVGRRVLLWPSDTVPRVAEVLSVDDHGWEFEIEGTWEYGRPKTSGTAYGYRVGDRFYVSHSMRLTLAELTDGDES